MELEGRVALSAMGKGFVLFQFEIESDMLLIWRRSSIKVGGQYVRFQKWRQDFNIHEKQIAIKMVWICFPDLPLEYWHEKIPLTMAKAVRRPMAIDKHTRTVLMGGFARIQVEMEIGSSRIEETHVERLQPGTQQVFWFKQKVIYEDKLGLCGFCKKLGHLVSDCRILKQVEANADEEAMPNEAV
ncbi:uncharacterized protein LOC122063871 [Macadamia integrifolia]|uniref:uncharacterized protein LOC122063871 n=1 Tax=Macadamia integrifolia TaxID=60698 RepID=UPI001C4E9614|nr:uncharacterized protein LOC122063871 [Macadamia integrifolia]